MMTPLEEAQALVKMDARPPDIREQIAALEKQADEFVERPMFAWVWESLDVQEGSAAASTKVNSELTS